MSIEKKIRFKVPQRGGGSLETCAVKIVFSISLLLVKLLCFYTSKILCVDKSICTFCMILVLVVLTSNI